MSALQTARQAWGDDLPDWVSVMAEACEGEGSSQKKVAVTIGYSPAVVNTVLKRTYKGDLMAVKQAVEGALLHAVMQCPVLGEIQANTCLINQRKPYANTNPIRIRLYQACHGTCPHSRLSKEKS